MPYIKTISLALLMGSATLILNQAQADVADGEAVYKKASPDATIKIRLHSTSEKTRFLIDGVDVGSARRITALVNNLGHTVVAKPEDCARSKEEYIQPPYNYEAPLSFTFFPEDCDEKVITNETHLDPDPSPTSVTNNGNIILNLGGTVSNITGRDKNTQTFQNKVKNATSPDNLKPGIQKESSSSEQKSLNELYETCIKLLNTLRTEKLYETKPEEIDRLSYKIDLKDKDCKEIAGSFKKKINKMNQF